MNLRILAEAEAESARQHLLARSLRVSRRFVDDIERTLDAIAQRPETFSKLETLPDDAPYRRALLRVFRYAIVFEILADEVLVAVAHTSREPNYWLDRGG